MRFVSSAEAAREFGRICEAVVAPGAEPVAVTHSDLPQVVVVSFEEYQRLLRRTRFAGTMADLPGEDLAVLATVDQRNSQP